MDVLLPLIIQLASRALGGNLAGSDLKYMSLGTVLNSVVGVLGGGMGGQLLGLLGLGMGSGRYGHSKHSWISRIWWRCWRRIARHCWRS